VGRIYSYKTSAKEALLYGREYNGYNAVLENSFRNLP